MQLQLETGRTHQIRVHVSSLGHPILGDKIYGGKLEKHMKMPRQALHAHKLEIRHPISGKPKNFISSLATDLDFYLKSHKPIGEKL